MYNKPIDKINGYYRGFVGYGGGMYGTKRNGRERNMKGMCGRERMEGNGI